MNYLQSITATNTGIIEKKYKGTLEEQDTIIHAMRSVLAFDGFDSKKHSGIVAEFRKSYIKTGIFKDELSIIIGRASEIRNASDYDDMFILKKMKRCMGHWPVSVWVIEFKR